MSFELWFRTFLEEKEVDLSEPVTAGDGSQLFIGDVCSNILSTTAQEQAAIKKMITLIDIKNGDVVDYLRQLAGALTESNRVTYG